MKVSKLMSTFLVGSLLVFSNGISLASTVNVSGGTYYNNPGGNTTFSNNGGVLQVQSGQTVRGLENSTNNGGHLIFNAGTVRIDGVVDVSALKSGNVFLGNGGRVDVNANVFLHNGAIYANGRNGGFVNVNVGSMMMGPNSRIEANGYNGYAGQVKINAQNGFDMPNGAVITANGIPVEDLNTNNVEVMASIVNMDGRIEANGIQSDGGRIVLVATGKTCDPCNVPEGSGNLTLGPNAVIQANGSDFEPPNVETENEGVSAGNGGSITLKASNEVIIQGQVEAKGGNGGEYQSGTVTVLDHYDTVQTGTEQLQVGTETVQTGTETVTETHKESGDIGKFNSNAKPDDVDLNDLDINHTDSYEVEGITKNIDGGILETPDLTVYATYFKVGSKDQVRIKIVDESGNTVFNKVYNSNDSHDTHIEVTFQSEFTKNGETTDVNVSRDMNVTISKLDNSHNDPNANVVLLPQHEGGEWCITYETTTEVPIYEEVPIFEERPVYSEVPVYREDPVFTTVDGGNGGLVTIQSTNATEENFLETNISVNGGTPNGENGEINFTKTDVVENEPCIVTPPTCEGSNCNPEEPPIPPEEPPVAPEPPTPPVVEEPSLKPVETPKYDPGALLFPFIQEGEIRGGSIVIIGFDNEEMFFDPTYQATLQEILNLAHKTYQEQRANGATEDEAFKTVHDVLIIEGFTKNVVTKLLPTLTNTDRDQFLKKQFDSILVSDNFNKEELFKNLKVKRWVIKVPVFLNRFGGYRYWNESQI